MKLGRVDEKGLVVMKKGQQMDSWGILISGCLEMMSEGVPKDGEEEEEEEGRILQPGNWFVNQFL